LSVAAKIAVAVQVGAGEIIVKEKYFVKKHGK